MKMKTYDVICSLCGHLNRNLYLGETGSFMECERCHFVVPVTEAYIRSEGASSSPSYSPLKQVSFADLAACEQVNESRRL